MEHKDNEINRILNRAELKSVELTTLQDIICLKKMKQSFEISDKINHAAECYEKETYSNETQAEIYEKISDFKAGAMWVLNNIDTLLEWSNEK